MITRDYKLTDPEFAQLFEHFAFDEVVSEESAKLDEADRHLAILAALLGCQGIDEFRSQVSRALKAGPDPCNGKRGCISGHGLSGYRKGQAFPGRSQRYLYGKRNSPPAGRPVHHN